MKINTNKKLGLPGLNYAFLMTALVIVFQFQNAQSQNNKKSKKAKIAMLGMFHFGATNDVGAIVMKDVLGKKRQSEIKEVVQKLASYKPTKVLVEHSVHLDSSLNVDYKKYLKGEFKLPKKEKYQIGFRLAKLLGHKKVYAIDSKLPLPFDAISKFCQQNNRMDELNLMMKKVFEFTGSKTKELSNTTLANFLKDNNTNKMDQFTNETYLSTILNFGNTANEVGAELSSKWYKRNMMILRNIDKVIEDRDNALVIIGAAHRAVIKDFVNNRSDLNYTEIASFLK